MLPEAEKAAFEFLDLVQNECSRIQIAGSIRRQVRERPIKDIEIVAIPKMEKKRSPQLSLFSSILSSNDDLSTEENLLDTRLKELLGLKVLKLDRKSSDGKNAPFGPRYYRLTYNCSRMGQDYPVDVFTVQPPADWGIIMTIRTGPAEFSHLIVTEALRRGMKVQDGQLFKRQWTKGDPPIQYMERVPCLTEPDFFRALDIPYLTAEERETITPFELGKQWGHQIYAGVNPERISTLHAGEIPLEH